MVERIQAYAFSACTFDINGKSVVVYNPLRSVERRASDIAHELAHIILDHELSEVQFINGVPFRTCMADQEEQATALGGTPLLPRALVIDAARDGDSWHDVAVRLKVTEDMARFRWNISGVTLQADAARRRRNQ